MTSEDARRAAMGEGASSDPTSREWLRYGKRRVLDPKTDPKLKFAYWDRIGQYMGLWGPKAKPREAPEAIPPVVEEEES